MMRSLGEVRLPSLRPPTLRPTEVVAKPASKNDFLRSMNYTWSSVLYEIPQVTRKETKSSKKKRRQELSDYESDSKAQARAPTTPKTPSSRYRKTRNTEDKYYGSSKRYKKPKTPLKLKDIKCRHKDTVTCGRCKPDESASNLRKGNTPRPTPRTTPRYTPRITPRLTPRSTSLREGVRSETGSRPIARSQSEVSQSHLRLPPIHRAYSIAALRKHKEAAHDFLHDLKSTFPRKKTPNSRSSSVQNLAFVSKQPSAGNLRRSRSVNSVSDHVSRLKHSRSVQSLYGVAGPNIPLHLTRSYSVESLNSYRGNHRSRENSRKAPRDRSGRSGSQSVRRAVVEKRSAGRSRSLSVQSRMPSGGRRSRANSQPGSCAQSRDSTRSKTGAAMTRSRSLAKIKPPNSSTSKTRATSRDRPRQPPPQVFVRLAKTPSAPDIYRAASRQSLTSNDGGNKKRLPLYIAIKPENQMTEKEKFFRSNFMYSPVFHYQCAASDNQLQKYSRASDRLLHLAVHIMTNAIRRFGTYEKYMELAGGRKLSRYEIIQAAKSYLKQEDMEDEVDIIISEDLLSRARMSMVAGRPTVIIRATNMREHWVDGMLRHEIGTHYMRAWNNKLQIWGSSKRRKEHQLEPANPTEEGLASLHSIIFRKDPCLWRCAMLYYTIYQATQMSFAEVFNDLGRFVKDPEVRWEYCLRAKRGQHDTSIPGAFCKDQVYLNGALQLLKHIEDVDFHTLVRCGKVSYRDIPKLLDIGLITQRTRIPGFMTDQVLYKKELQRIMQRNGLTKEHLEILP